MIAQPTLTSVFEGHYLPLRLFDATAESIALYRLVLRRWSRITGDPQIQEITPEVLAKFTAALAESPGIRRHGREAPGGKMSVNTIRGYLRSIQTLLDFCGPRGRYQRDALGILAEPAWIRPPRESLPEPRIVPLERLSECYRAAKVMQFPRQGRLKASTWWRCLLVAAFNTGLRRGTLLRFECSEIDWDQELLKIPAHKMKSRRAHTLPLNEVASTHLRRLANGSGPVFRWPWRKERVTQHLYRIQEAVGIEPEDRFGLQDIRRTAGTMVARVSSPEIARAFLAHAATDTAMRHYINGQGLLGEAVRAMPQPQAFAKGR